MPEEYEVGTDKAQEIIDEQHAEHHQGRPRWLDMLALSTALFAVLAALSALHAGDKANEALLTANKAVLVQTQAVDTWMQFQADSLKKSQQSSLALILGKLGGTPQEIAKVQQEGARRQAQQNTLKKEAAKLDTEAAALVKESQHILSDHQRFALAVTLFQIAIGLSAISALLRQPVIWWGSLLAGGWASSVLIMGLLTKH
ncbi:hypothetical protein Dxin01_03568 [Deinococcus xinjiangensis]|uniref:DUF4337 domain-containing protein n=1 Tax=Deinococcus xinjiangensis TaxID=457454 RepID=A0ABP9VF08_9DEIO